MVLLKHFEAFIIIGVIINPEIDLHLVVKLTQSKKQYPKICMLTLSREMRNHNDHQNYHQGRYEYLPKYQNYLMYFEHGGLWSNRPKMKHR